MCRVFESQSGPVFYVVCSKHQTHIRECLRIYLTKFVEGIFMNQQVFLVNVNTIYFVAAFDTSWLPMQEL